MALVRAMRKLFLVVSLSLAVGGCKGDPNKPEYWEKAIGGAKNKKEKLRKLDDLRSNKEIANALGEIADPKAAGTLLKCLNLKDNYTVIAAVDGLGQMKAKEAV